jgi:hypothetical protein
MQQWYCNNKTMRLNQSAGISNINSERREDEKSSKSHVSIEKQSFYGVFNTKLHLERQQPAQEQTGTSKAVNLTI